MCPIGGCVLYFDKHITNWEGGRVGRGVVLHSRSLDRSLSRVFIETRAMRLWSIYALMKRI